MKIRDTADAYHVCERGWGSARGGTEAIGLSALPPVQRYWMLSAKLAALSLAGTVLACARPTFERQRLADGSFQFKCEDRLAACLSYVDEICKGGPFVVDGGWDEPRMSGVDQNRVESHRSQVRVRCIHPRALANPPFQTVRATSAAHAAPDQSKPAPPSTAAAPARVCVPGASQACVGPAGCTGGQACLPNGSGFGPCDCGQR